MKKKSFLMAIVLILVFALCGCVGGADSDTSNTTTKTTEAPKTNVPGDTIAKNGWKITLTKAVQTQTTGDDIWESTAEDGKTFIILYFIVENTSEEELYFNYLYVKSYLDKTTCDQDIVIGTIDGYDWLTGEIAAGKKREGCLKYTVKDDWQELEISYKDGLINPVEIFTYKITPETVS